MWEISWFVLAPLASTVQKNKRILSNADLPPTSESIDSRSKV